MKMAISVIYTLWRCFFQTFQAVVTFLRRKMSRLKSKARSNAAMNELFGNIEDVYGASYAACGGTPDVCQTVVQVVALVPPELKIEITCIAHL